MAKNNIDEKMAAKRITVRGRLGFPRFTHSEAVEFNQKYSQHKKAAEEINSSFALYLDQEQLDRLIAHIKDNALPYFAKRGKADEKGDALPEKQVQQIQDFLDEGDWADQPPYMFIKAINPKYAEDTPEAVAMIELKGPKNGDITVKAGIASEDDLEDPEIKGTSIKSYPAVVDIDDTVFDMYAGANVAATINLFAYSMTKANFGIGAGANTAVYRGDLPAAPKLGSGDTSVDEDSIFN